MDAIRHGPRPSIYPTDLMRQDRDEADDSRGGTDPDTALGERLSRTNMDDELERPSFWRLPPVRSILSRIAVLGCVSTALLIWWAFLRRASSAVDPGIRRADQSRLSLRNDRPSTARCSCRMPIALGPMPWRARSSCSVHSVRSASVVTPAS